MKWLLIANLMPRMGVSTQIWQTSRAIQTSVRVSSRTQSSKGVKVDAPRADWAATKDSRRVSSAGQIEVTRSTQATGQQVRQLLAARSRFEIDPFTVRGGTVNPLAMETQQTNKRTRFRSPTTEDAEQTRATTASDWNHKSIQLVGQTVPWPALYSTGRQKCQVSAQN